MCNVKSVLEFASSLLKQANISSTYFFVHAEKH